MSFLFEYNISTCRVLKTSILRNKQLSDTELQFFLHVFFFKRERDELMDQVTSLKNRVLEMSHREEEAYQQMKKGIELVEQAQLEQTQVGTQL